MHSKADRQAWWNSLSLTEKDDYIKARQAKKAERRRKTLSPGGHKFNCQTCFHNKVGGCTDVIDNQVCSYWYDPNNTVKGTAYKQAL